MPNQVNTIIDRDFEMYDGFYKYTKGADGNESVYIKRDKLYEYIFKDYIYCYIVFKYVVEFNKENILYFKFEDE